ncbi:hypothetical protein E1295_13135 [Nonomuraea mesophila]|uniref:Uncharacterized protein n=1 Tax=Nonomuraea mesophila TaxID=2530382 RepID=A0A4R5FST8_9ACTN|nr:hypothetical protein [Nonomuraea mesophila]TDE55874.1 hypothetical protein E1295_13135 [Nonomuraea mesophila]
MTPLERRYRAVLRLLPAAYRAEREEEMVDTFMEAAGGGLRRPGWGEIASVLALSARVRLGGPGAPPRHLAWGAAVRLVALLGLAYQTAYAAFGLAGLPYLLSYEGDAGLLGTAGSADRLGAIADYGFPCCSAVAFVAVMHGRPRTAKAAAVLGALPALAGATAMAPSLRDLVALVFTAVPVIALLLAFPGDAAPPRRGRWLTVVPLVAGLIGYGLSTAAAAAGGVRLSPWSEPLGMAVVALVAAAPFVAARGRSPGPALALAAAGALLLIVRLPAVIGLPLEQASAGVTAMFLAQCALLVPLVVVFAWRGWRSLPPARP